MPALHITQHKDESLLRAVDFAPDINGAAITAGTAETVVGDVVVSEDEQEGTKVRFRLAGGTPGRHKIEVTAETDAPETLVAVVSVYITG